MKPQFIIDYEGNKYDETKELDDHIETFKTFDTIIEPFCGSFGFSRYLYYNHYEDFKDKKYIFIDANTELINLYKYIQTFNNVEEYFLFVDEYNEYVNKLYELYKYDNTGKGQYFNGKEIKKYIKEYQPRDERQQYIHFLFKTNCLKGTFYQLKTKMNIEPLYFDLIKRAKFINDDFENILSYTSTINFKYNSYKSTLVYLDPPYLSTDVATYKDNFTILFDTIIYLMNTYNVIMTHEYNPILHYIFKDKELTEYNKHYNLSKKRIISKVYYNLA